MTSRSDGDGRAWQLAEWYQRRAPLDDVVIPALVELTQAHHVQQWWCGPDEPEHIAALARALQGSADDRRLCRVSAADDAVVPGIQTVTRQLALRGDGTRGLYIDPEACAHTVAEYLSYEYEQGDADSDARPTDTAGPDGRKARPASERPIKAADHAMDATRYALHSDRRLRTAAGRTDAYLRDLKAWAAMRQRPGTRGPENDGPGAPDPPGPSSPSSPPG